MSRINPTNLRSVALACPRTARALKLSFEMTLHDRRSLHSTKAVPFKKEKRNLAPAERWQNLAAVKIFQVHTKRQAFALQERRKLPLWNLKRSTLYNPKGSLENALKQNILHSHNEHRTKFKLCQKRKTCYRPFRSFVPVHNSCEIKKKIERTGKRTFLQFATACDITQTAWNKIKTNSAKWKTRKDICRAFIWHN